MPLDHSVSPPPGGSTLADSSAAMGGVSIKVTSVCQLSLSGGLPVLVSSRMISGTSASAW